MAYRPERAKVIYHYEAGRNNELKQISVMEKFQGRRGGGVAEVLILWLFYDDFNEKVMVAFKNTGCVI